MKKISYIVVFFFLLQLTAFPANKPLSGILLFNTNNPDVRLSYTYDAGLNKLEEYVERKIDSSWTRSGRTVYYYDDSARLRHWSIQWWTGSVWLEMNKYERNYDENGNPTEYSSYMFNAADSTIIPLTRITYAYSVKGLMTQQIEERYSSSSFINSKKTTYQYNDKDSLIQYIIEKWDNNSWSNSAKVVYDYDSQGNQTRINTYGWNGSIWDNSMKTEMQYDANNNMTLKTIEYWEDGAWLKYEKKTWSYNAQNLVSQLNFFRTSNNDWYEIGRTAYEYSATGKMLLEKGMSFEDNVWYDGSKDFYSYDAQDMLLEQTRTTYVKDSGWANSYKYSYTYSDGLMSTAAYYTWSNGAWTAGNTNLYYTDHRNNRLYREACRLVFKYSNITDIEESREPAAPNEIFPNPAGGMIYINNVNPGTAYRIYDINGKPVLTGSYSGQIDVSQLTPGVYLIFFSDKSQMFIKM